MRCSGTSRLRVVPLLLLLHSALTAAMTVVQGGARSWDVNFRRDGVEHTLRVPEGVPVLQVPQNPLRHPPFSPPHIHLSNCDCRPPRQPA